MSKPVVFFNRYTQTLQNEPIYGEAYLRWLYEGFGGQLTRFLLIKRSFFSRFFGKRMRHPRSKKKILPFIKDYHIDMSESLHAAESFDSFDAFFSRKLTAKARPIAPTPAVFPADGRHLLVENIGAHDSFYAKGQRFNLESFLGSAPLAKRYKQGTLLLSRLCPTDYHRFHFPCACTPKTPRLIKGNLYSVSPIALSKNLAYLWNNRRMITELDSPHFGTLVFVEVGATCVGSIHQTFTPHQSTEPGSPKGYFSFGGSLVATLFPPQKIDFASDLRKQSALGYETYARMGDILAL